MAERAFVQKLQRVGFADPTILERRDWGISDCARYPLFDEQLLRLMRDLLPSGRHDAVASVVVIRAEKPSALA